MSRNVGLHLLQWKLQDIIPQLKTIKQCNYDFIQISPIQPCKYSFETPDWWRLFQPYSYKIGNCLGDKEDLIKLCNEAKKYDIKIVVDVVLNHMASKDSGELLPHKLVDKRLTSNEEFWRPFKVIDNWEDRCNQVLKVCDGLPTLKLERYDLQNLIIKFLNDLMSCGIGGLRFDSAKSIALPEEGSSFWTRILNNLDNNDLFNYAEVIFADKQLLDKYNKYINVVTNSRSSDLHKMVSYVESHDSFLNESMGWTRKMTDEMLIREWEVLMQNREWNVLFYARPWSNLWCSEEIKRINNTYK